MYFSSLTWRISLSKTPCSDVCSISMQSQALGMAHGSSPSSSSSMWTSARIANQNSKMATSLLETRKHCVGARVVQTSHLSRSPNPWLSCPRVQSINCIEQGQVPTDAHLMEHFLPIFLTKFSETAPRWPRTASNSADTPSTPSCEQPREAKRHHWIPLVPYKGAVLLHRLPLSICHPLSTMKTSHCAQFPIVAETSLARTDCSHQPWRCSSDNEIQVA